MKCRLVLTNLSGPYPDLFVSIISQRFMEHILLNIKLPNLCFDYYFLYIKNSEEIEKNNNKRKKPRKKAKLQMMTLFLSKCF